MKTAYLKYSGLFFFTFFGLSAIIPLLANYLKSIGLSGVQIGTIASVGSFITMFSPTIFGFIADKTHHRKLVLQIAMIMAILLSLLLGWTINYTVLLILFSIFYIFQKPLNSLVSGLALQAPLPFGSIRLWGSIGYALAILILGYLSDKFGLKIIFIVFSIAMSIALIITFLLKPTTQKESHTSTASDIKQLVRNKTFLLFLCFTFLYGGTIVGNNVYFGLYYQHLGGSLTSLGFALLLITISEAPFMRWTSRWTAKYGVENVLLASSIVLSLRWLWYATGPSIQAIIVGFLIQGFAYGTFIIATAEFIKQSVPKSLHLTTMALYASVSIGLGGMVTSYVSGYLLDYYSPTSLYILYSIFTALSIFFILFIRKATNIQKINVL